MNFFFLRRQHILRILLPVVFLISVGTGAYYCTHQETKLTFHSDWTEIDRLQMQEIMEEVHQSRKKLHKEKSKEFSSILKKVLFDFGGDRERLWKEIKGYVQDYHDQDLVGQWEYVVCRTARTGNDLYVDQDGWNMLQIACYSGKIDLASRLVDMGANVNACGIMKENGTENMMIPLEVLVYLLAKSKDDCEAKKIMNLLEKMISHGANVNVRVGKITLLDCVCNLSMNFPSDRQEELALKLIDWGADVRDVHSGAGKKEVSPLFFPVTRGLSKVVRRLCEMGVDVNAWYEAVPALFAVNFIQRPECQVEIATVLLDYGAEINIRDESGDTPLFNLCSRVDELETYSSAEKECLFDLTDLYLKRGALVNPDSAWSTGTPPLMRLFAMESTSEEINKIKVVLARKLLKYGANPSLKNEKGEAVLDLLRKYADDGKSILEQLPELQSGKEKREN